MDERFRCSNRAKMLYTELWLPAAISIPPTVAGPGLHPPPERWQSGEQVTQQVPHRDHCRPVSRQGGRGHEDGGQDHGGHSVDAGCCVPDDREA